MGRKPTHRTSYVVRLPTEIFEEIQKHKGDNWERLLAVVGKKKTITIPIKTDTLEEIEQTLTELINLIQKQNKEEAFLRAEKKLGEKLQKLPSRDQLTEIFNKEIKPNLNKMHPDNLRYKFNRLILKEGYDAPEAFDILKEQTELYYPEEDILND